MRRFLNLILPTYVPALTPTRASLAATLTPRSGLGNCRELPAIPAFDSEVPTDLQTSLKSFPLTLCCIHKLQTKARRSKKLLSG